MSPTNTPPRAELIDQAAARPLRARSPPAYEPRSTRKARITMNHSKPLTRWPESHITAYASVVQGSRKKPSSGTTQLSNARLSRSLKIAMKNSASRAEISAKSASRQPIAQARIFAFWAANSSSVSTPWAFRSARSLSWWIGSTAGAAGAGGGGAAYCCCGSSGAASSRAHLPSWRCRTRPATDEAVPATTAVRAIPRSSPGMTAPFRSSGRLDGVDQVLVRDALVVDEDAAVRMDGGDERGGPAVLVHDHHCRGTGFDRIRGGGKIVVAEQAGRSALEDVEVADSPLLEAGRIEARIRAVLAFCHEQRVEDADRALVDLVEQDLRGAAGHRCVGRVADHDDVDGPELFEHFCGHRSPPMQVELEHPSPGPRVHPPNRVKRRCRSADGPRPEALEVAGGELRLEHEPARTALLGEGVAPAVVVGRCQQHRELGSAAPELRSHGEAGAVGQHHVEQHGGRLEPLHLLDRVDRALGNAQDLVATALEQRPSGCRETARVVDYQHSHASRVPRARRGVDSASA